MTSKYSSQNICVLVPTKDRPEHVERLLKSLADQVESVGRIILVASGQDIKSTIDKFIDKLPIEYFHTSQTGQIKQRNIGISKLDDRTPLVACIDDDIIIDPSAIKEMVHFWSNAPPDTAGVGFNIINGPILRPSIFEKMLYLSDSKPGSVLRSGNSTPICHLKEHIRSQWLNGGTTVWKKDVLVNNLHKEINTKWAIAEDLIFSYPLGKMYSLFVCAGATVQHNHDNHPRDNNWHYFHGRTQTLWLYHFVKSNKDLSMALFLYTLLLRVAGKLTIGIVMLRMPQMAFASGVLGALCKITAYSLKLISKDDVREV